MNPKFTKIHHMNQMIKTMKMTSHMSNQISKIQINKYKKANLNWLIGRVNLNSIRKTSMISLRKSPNNLTSQTPQTNNFKLIQLVLVLLPHLQRNLRFVRIQ